MRYILLVLALAAALVIVCISGTTLFFTAFNSAKDPWQQWLQGSGMAAVVAWEASALLVIILCFRDKYWVIGIGSIVLLVLAMGVTSRQDLRLYLVGGADMTATKTVRADDRNRVRVELDRAYARRDNLQKSTKLTVYQKTELTEVKSRIRDLELRWDTQTESVRATGSAEGELAHQFFGFDVDMTQAALDALPMLLFWMFARVFAIPAATVAIVALWSGRKRKEAPVAVPATTVAAIAEPPAVALPEAAPAPTQEAVVLTPRFRVDLETEKPAPVRLQTVTEDGIPLTSAEKKRRAQARVERLKDEAIAAVQQFADECLSTEDLVRGTRKRKKGREACVISGGSKGKVLQQEFRRWCKGVPKYSHLGKMNDSHLGRAFNVVMECGRDGRGSVYGARLREDRRAVAA